MADPGTVAVKAALTAVQVGLSMLNKIEGPRLDDLNVTLADYGTPITYFWGKRRLEGRPIIWAEKLREKKKTSKGKGGKYADYQYFGTWACLIAGHEIDTVSRIWLDKHLVYDATKGGPMSPLLGLFQGLGNSPVKISRGKNMRFYDGTQTAPDRRMEEWCEDRYGPDTCPAYKGMAYIVFEELPLEKFGNRIPQVTIEAVNTKTDQYLSDTLDGTGGPEFTPDFMRFYMDGAIWDTATHTKIVDVENRPDAFDPDGTYWHLSGNFPAGPLLHNYSYDGNFERGEGIPSPAGADEVILVSGYKVLRPYGAVLGQLILLEADVINVYSIDFCPTMGLPGEDATPYLLGKGAAPGIHVSTIASAKAGIASEIIPTGNSGNVVGWINSEGEWVLVQDGEVHRVDPATLNILQTESGSFSVTDVSADGGGVYFWTVSGSTAVEYSMLDLSVVRSVNLLNYGSAGLGGIYDPVNHAIAQVRIGNTKLLYLDRVGSAGTDLADVVDDVAEWCGFDPADIDTSDLDQVVQGYSVTQGAGKDMLQPLMDIHDVEARPHDFGAEFLKRGQPTNGSVSVENFVREGDEPRYVVTIKQDTDLPRRVSVNFADQDKDQQANTVISQRPLDGTDATREQTIDLGTYVATPGDMQKAADRYFRRQWNERESISLGFTAQHLAAEPGDTYDLSLDGSTRYGRIRKWTLSGGKIQLEFVRDALSFATLNSGSGSSMDGRDDDEVYISAPAKGIILDIPLVRDADNSINPLLYYGAGGYSDANFPGAIIFERDYNEDEYFEWNAVDSVDRAVWGYATEALPSANCNVWDNASSVNIRVRGELTSCTQADVDGNPLTNLAYLGGENGQGELLNFTTATLEGDGTYTLSGLKRGRRGTDVFVGDHANGDTFVLVSSLEFDGRGLDDISTELGFKTQTLGRDVDSAISDTLEYTAATLKPYAPAHFTARKNPSNGDWEFTWVRRTRVGGNWSGGSTIPLGETSENYKVRIYNGSTVVRTITSTSEAATYTSAQQTTDFGGSQTKVRAGIAQIADAVDGFENTITFGAAPFVRGVGTMDGTTGAVLTLDAPPSIFGDLLLLFVETDTAADVVTAPTGWQEIMSEGGTDARLSVFWKRADHSEATVSVSKPGNHIIGVVISVAGVIASGNPFNGINGTTDSGSSFSIPGFTTDFDNCLIFDSISGGGASSWANSDLTSLTELADQTISVSTGGGLAINSGFRAVAGAIGATTLTRSGPDNFGVIKFAVRPA